MERVLCIVIGYIFGLFQSGYIVGRLNGIDIRDVGSKNAGTTNTLRSLGAKAGAIVLLGDAFKCLFAILLCRFLFKDAFSDCILLVNLYAGLGAVLGHNFPFYLKFKGGKGIACTAGIVLSFGVVPTLVLATIFFGIFAITHYVSFASLCLYASIFVLSIVCGENGFFGFMRPFLNEAYIIIGILTIMAYVQHRSNIMRLLTKTERKTYIKKKGDLNNDSSN